ncbi:hypothetical protein A9Q84_09130 [Halobacteriovorax marinus]|uniref:Uncharacterized protein n=1 Tax=Halobacteriovorax marinus TaxID=97084 RepID=A0A1Y5FAI7_9BACT|nr:hypothetical protein A9Q84_09130 [Halobacteriovorax marinus]
MKKLLLPLLSLFIFADSASAGFWDFLKPAEINERIREEIADLDVRFNVDLVDVDLFEGLGISSRYRYEVERSYIANFHTRVDKWEIKVDLSPGDIIKDALDLPIYLNIDRDSSVYFVRQFPTKKEALLAKPYLLHKLPVTAERALKHLQPGDFVSIPASMSVAIGASSGFLDRIDGLDAAARVYAVINGKFLIHVFRMKDNKVRVKLIAQRSNARGADASIEGDLEIFGVSILDRQVSKIFDLDFISVGMSKGHGSQFIIDYVFDLNDENAKKAYNQILSSSYKFKDLSIFGEFLRERQLENRLLSSYELADKVFEEDRHLDMKRVERIFKGANNYDFDRSKLKLGLILASFKREVSYTENVISYEDEDGKDKFFFYPIYTKYKRLKFGVWPFKYKEKSTKSFFGLVPIKTRDDEGEIYSDYGFTYEVKDKLFLQTEQVKFKQLVRDAIPETLYKGINWNQFDDETTHRSARGFVQVIFKAAAFADLSEISFEDLNDKLQKFYRNRKYLEAGVIHGFWSRLWRTITIVKLSEKRSLKKIAKELHVVLTDKSLSGKQRIKNLMELRERSLFEKIGIGFLVSLIKQSELKEKLFITMSLHAKDASEVTLKFGDQEFSDLYHELQFAHGAINDRSWDLRMTNDQEITEEEISSALVR